uniref:NADH-ubiquinone oxidoreductase chain 2 n=1 Tax=Eisenia spelaea TaxID=1502428 RepID=A0A6B9ITC1_9ANNE|nr:NADH dehydrogenase subunit 2 [Eisenia spelaea]
MNLIYSPTMLLMVATLFLSTLMALSSSNWVLLWAAMELNLLSFIPIMLQTKTGQEVEGSVKYYLAQAWGSALLLFSSASMWVSFSWAPNFLPLILTSSILLKLGSVPCHFWYPSVMASISWTSCLILSTWQKLAPLMILTFLLPQKSNQYIMAVSGLNALVGGLMGMNHSRLRVIMAYSSIGHIGWMLSLLGMYKPAASTLYFIVYSFLITPLFLTLNFLNLVNLKHLSTAYMNSSTCMTLAILLLSLGGLPPLTGFTPKFMAVSALTGSMSNVMLMLIIGSIMNLYFYLNIIINTLLSTPHLKPVSSSKSLTSGVLLTTAIFSLGLSPVIIM